jgi:uncharacterized protein YjbI with pentapeptide repeats
MKFFKKYWLWVVIGLVIFIIFSAIITGWTNQQDCNLSDFDLDVCHFLGIKMWSWLELLIAPVVLSILGVLTDQYFKYRDKDNQRQAALKNYYDKMTNLMEKESWKGYMKKLRADEKKWVDKEIELNKASPTVKYNFKGKLLPVSKFAVFNINEGRRRISEVDPEAVCIEGNQTAESKSDQNKAESKEISREKPEVVYIAEALTLAVLRELNGERKGLVIEFLYKSDMLNYLNLSYADMCKADFRNFCLDGADFTLAQLDYADFRCSLLQFAAFSSCKLEGADFTEAALAETIFRGIDLRHTNFHKANLRDTVFFATDLSGNDLSGNDISSANFSNANLRNANLRNANLRNANLSGNDLSSANFSKANLSNANLSKANLSNANLSDANLSEANLSGANNLTKDQLSKAKLCRTKLPQGFNPIKNRDCQELGIDPITGKPLSNAPCD